MGVEVSAADLEIRDPMKVNKTRNRCVEIFSSPHIGEERSMTPLRAPSDAAARGHYYRLRSLRSNKQTEEPTIFQMTASSTRESVRDNCGIKHNRD